MPKCEPVRKLRKQMQRLQPGLQSASQHEREHRQFARADIRETPTTQEKPKTRENAEEKGDETKEPTSEPENLNYTCGRQRQPKESGENAYGTLRYEKETQTWQCAQCERKFAATDARGSTAHVASGTRKMGRKEDNENNKSYKIAPTEMLTK